MKHVYISTDDISTGLIVNNGKVEISSNYLTKAELDATYQKTGEYATTEELMTLDTKVDGLSDVYQPLGNYLSTEKAYEEFISLDALAEYATKEYVDTAIENIDLGALENVTGFDGSYEGNSVFTGDMVITGELTVESLYDSTNARQVRVAEIVTNDDLNELLPTLGSGSESSYVLPAASSTTLGGVKIGSGVQVTADGTISVELPEQYEYELPTASSATLGGVKIGSGVQVANDGTISVAIPEQEKYTLPAATTSALGGIKVGSGLSINEDGVLAATTTSYTLPVASKSTLGGVKIGDGLQLATDGTISTTGESSEFSGDKTIDGDLYVTGSVYYGGAIEEYDTTSSKYKGFKVLYERGTFVIGTPYATGEITYNEDGTFTDKSGLYSGKLDSRGYLDLSVEARVLTTFEQNDLIGRNIMIYVEMEGKPASAAIFGGFCATASMESNSIFTANGYVGAGSSSDMPAFRNAMTSDVNKILFTPESSDGGAIFVNGKKLSLSLYVKNAHPVTTNMKIIIPYTHDVCSVLVKKVAIIDMDEYNYSGDEDGISITENGFDDYVKDTALTLRNASSVSHLSKQNQVLSDALEATKLELANSKAEIENLYNELDKLGEYYNNLSSIVTKISTKFKL